MTTATTVPKRVEEALFFRLKQKAFQECSDYSRAYADCCRGKLVSIAWSCRAEAQQLSDCMSSHTGRLEELKQRYVAAGSPASPDWDSLLQGM